MAGDSALGWQRVRSLRHRLLGLPVASDTPAATEALPDISGGYPVSPLRGLAVGDLPVAWQDVLGWAGVPLAREGPWHWGIDLQPGAVARPTPAARTLLLPPPTQLRSCSGVELRPLRLAVAQAIGCRLQAGPGIHLFCWDALVVAVSTRDVPLGGFLTGPRPGSRATLALEPGGVQVVRW